MCDGKLTHHDQGTHITKTFDLPIQRPYHQTFHKPTKSHHSLTLHNTLRHTSHITLTITNSLTRTQNLQHPNKLTTHNQNQFHNHQRHHHNTHLQRQLSHTPTPKSEHILHLQNHPTQYQHLQPTTLHTLLKRHSNPTHQHATNRKPPIRPRIITLNLHNTIVTTPHNNPKSARNAHKERHHLTTPVTTTHPSRPQTSPTEHRHHTSPNTHQPLHN